MPALVWRVALLPTLLTFGCTLSPPAPQQARDVSGTTRRIIYPQDNLQTLTLPDGRRQTVHSLLNVPRPLRYGDYVWDDRNVPAGRAWVRVDLDRQTLSVFRDGYEIGTTLILYGADGKPTPTGVFPILQKARQHHSSLYQADMPYMLRLTGDGVAIHASNVRRRAATHGCIGVPAAFAQLLFGEVERGDIVAIQRGGMPVKAARQA